MDDDVLEEFSSHLSYLILFFRGRVLFSLKANFNTCIFLSFFARYNINININIRIVR
jgi:hypothetical protein